MQTSLFAPLGEDARLIRAELHNNTDAPQNLVLHYMASAWDPVPSYRGFSLPGCEVSLPEKAAFVWAKDYDTLDFFHPPSQRMSDLGWSAPGEEAVPGFGQGYGIGMGFGCSEGKGPFGQVVPNGKGTPLPLRFPLPRPCVPPVSVYGIGIRQMKVPSMMSMVRIRYSCRPVRSLPLPSCR